MHHTAKSVPKVSVLMISFLLFLGVKATYPKDQMATSRGTVNIALANPNAIVLLTDSLESYRQANGWHHHAPVQKLFRLDDKTVCSIAGFGSEKGWPDPRLNVEVRGIIADFQDQLMAHPVVGVDAKLRAIGFLVGHYIDVVANRMEVISAASAVPSNYDFQVIVAGYESDGQPKIEKLVITPLVPNAAKGRAYWSHTTKLELPRKEYGLSRLLGGITSFSSAVLDNPEQFPDSPAIQRYARSKRSDGRDLLTGGEIAALASAMAAQTARGTHFVGGADQIAVLSSGKIIKFDQPHFTEPPRPLKFALMVSPNIVGVDNLITTPGVLFLWIRTRFSGFWDPRLRLDDQFFYGCEIRDSIVEYSGGLTDFGPTNTVVDSMLFPYRVISPDSLTRMSKAFPWRSQPPDVRASRPSVTPN